MSRNVTLSAAELEGKHRYLARARPEWRASMSAIRRAGGPWYCVSCDGPSYLSYRNLLLSLIPMFCMDKPSKKQLSKMYYDAGLNQSEIGERFGVSQRQVSDWMSDYDISPGRGGAVQIAADADDLERLYYREGLSQTEIAEKYDVSQGVISDRMEKYDIAPGKRTDLAAEAARVPWATYRTTDDGYEVWRARDGSNMHTVVVHRLLMVAEKGLDAVCEHRVHHKNEIPWDNRPENLELLTDTEHKRHHANNWDRDEKGRFKFR